MCHRSQADVMQLVDINVSAINETLLLHHQYGVSGGCEVSVLARYERGNSTLHF